MCDCTSMSNPLRKLGYFIKSEQNFSPNSHIVTLIILENKTRVRYLEIKLPLFTFMKLFQQKYGTQIKSMAAEMLGL